MKLLIVDDNPEVRRILRNIVMKSAMEVLECSDGGEAVATCQRARPDLVLMDLEMGGVDGLTATHEIKALCPETPVIIVSSHDHPELRAAAQEAGAVGYVVKDNLQQLRKWVDELRPKETTNPK